MRAISDPDERALDRAPRTAVVSGGAPHGAGRTPSRALRERLRRALPGLEPGLRVLAEGLPAQGGSIDLLGVDADGRLVLVFVAEDRGEADAPAALGLARALGTRAWVRAEMPGWLQLVPDLEVGRHTEVRCLLLARALSPTVRAAVDALPEGWIEPLIYRPFAHRGDEFLLLEQLSPPSPPAVRVTQGGPAAPAEQARPGDETEPRPGPPLPPLRSGLTEADFRQPAPRPGEPRRSERPRPRFEAAPEVAPAAARDTPRDGAR